MGGLGGTSAPAYAEETATASYNLDHKNVFFSSVALTSPVEAQMEYDESVAERAERLNTYFAKRDMPLAGYGEQFVRVADTYKLDWRLLPAIGVRESSGGKHLMNKNPFGWGSAKIPFKDFDEAIVEVTKHLAGAYPSTAKYYKDKTLERKLWYYNGSVMPAYTGEVIAIMNKF